MSDDQNPYKPPQELNSIETVDRKKTFKPLVAPAIALLVSGVLALMTRLLFFALVVWAKTYQRGVLAADLSDDFDKYWYIFVAMFLAALATIYGAIQMLRLQHYRACIAGAVIASIPILSPCYILGIPFGIWALAILLRQDTRAAFVEAN
jgi:uncharacterized membrane protein